MANSNRFSTEGLAYAQHPGLERRGAYVAAASEAKPVINRSSPPRCLEAPINSSIALPASLRIRALFASITR